MNTKELRPVSSLGMFDLLKGVAILSVIVFHTYSWMVSTEDHPLFMIVTSTFSDLLVYGFIIAAGFGIRKRTIKKCALQLKNMFLIPYVLTGLATTFLYSFNFFFLSSSFSDTFREALRYIASYAIGVFPATSYLGYELQDIGAVWFIVALTGGWFILNLILKYSDGWKRNLLVLLTSIIGYYGSLHASVYGIPIPFCFFYMFVFVLGLYIGYLAKEKKWLEKRLSPIAVIFICLSFAVFVWEYNDPFLFFGPLGFFTPYATAAVSFGVVYLMTHINRRESPITDFFEIIGHNSITILCVHTVESIGMHWYWFRDTLSNASITHMFIMILIYRLVFIALGMLVVTSFKNWGGFNRLKTVFSCNK